MRALEITGVNPRGNARYLLDFTGCMAGELIEKPIAQTNRLSTLPRGQTLHVKVEVEPGEKTRAVAYLVGKRCLNAREVIA